MVNAPVVPLREPRRFLDRAQLPHHTELEASVLGGILLRNETLATIPLLEPWHFYDHRNHVVFQAIRALEFRGVPIDTATVEAEVEKAGKLDAVGGPAYIGELALRVPTAENVKAYAKQVFDTAKLRDLALNAEQTILRVYENRDEADEIIAAARVSVERIERSQREVEGVRLITIPQAIAEGESLAAAPIFTTPFPTLNNAIGFGGLLGTQVYTIAAGTGRGKTSLIACIAGHSVEHDDVPVLVATWEMKPIYFVARRAAGLIGCHSNDIIRGLIPFRTVNAAMPYGRFFFLHRPTLTDLRRAALEIAQRFGKAPLIFADYLQKLAAFIARTSQQRPDLRMATSEASDALTEIADESKGAVVAVSSVGRGKGKILETPRKYDPYALVEVAKESGDVEYDGAGLLVVTHEKAVLDGNGEQIATLTVAKARFGRGVHVDMRYDGARGIWRDVGEVDALAPAAASVGVSTEKIRRRIADALREMGSLSNKDDIARKAKIQAQGARPEIDAMLGNGEIEKGKGGYRLTELGKANYPEVPR